MEIVDEFRHLEGIRSNFMLSESEYLAPVVSNEDAGIIASEIIYSNIKSFVNQNNISLICFGIRQYQLNKD